MIFASNVNLNRSCCGDCRNFLVAGRVYKLYFVYVKDSFSIAYFFLFFEQEQFDGQLEKELSLLRRSLEQDSDLALTETAEKHREKVTAMKAELESEFIGD